MKPTGLTDDMDDPTVIASAKILAKRYTLITEQQSDQRTAAMNEGIARALTPPNQP